MDSYSTPSKVRPHNSSLISPFPPQKTPSPSPHFFPQTNSSFSIFCPQARSLFPIFPLFPPGFFPFLPPKTHPPFPHNPFPFILLLFPPLPPPPPSPISFTPPPTFCPHNPFFPLSPLPAPKFPSFFPHNAFICFNRDPKNAAVPPQKTPTPNGAPPPAAPWGCCPQRASAPGTMAPSFGGRHRLGAAIVWGRLRPSP